MDMLLLLFMILLETTVYTGCTNGAKCHVYTSMGLHKTRLVYTSISCYSQAFLVYTGNAMFLSLFLTRRGFSKFIIGQ